MKKSSTNKSVKYKKNPKTIFHPHALQILSDDKRDLSHHRVYGTLGAAQIPNIDFDVSPIQIVLNQDYLDFCTTYSVSMINTLLQGIGSDPSLVNYLFRMNDSTSLNARAALAFAFDLVKSPEEYLALAKAGKNSDINNKLLDLLKGKKGLPYFDPNWQFAKTKQLVNDYKQWGANLRDAARSVVKYGSLLKAFSPYTFNEGKPTDRDRDFLANWVNWPADLDKKAAPFKAGSFWSVDGPLDMFDDIRSALWKNKQENNPSPVLFGMMWRFEWNSKDGILSEDYTTPDGSPHAIFIRGQKIINGKPYLRIQNSGGAGIGDKGFFYASRKVINLEATIPFGAFTFKKLALGDARYYNDNGIKITDNWITAVAKVLATYCRDLITKA